MAQQITPFSIGAPGFYGLNTQDAPVGIDPAFSLEATNCVIDKYGRIGSRKGWTKATTTNADLGTATVDTAKFGCFHIAELLSLIHISEPTRRTERSRMPSSA